MEIFRIHSGLVGFAVVVPFFWVPAVQAVTTIFFNASQMANLVATNTTSDTVSSSGYVFTYSLDKWWYPAIGIGPGTPTGRYLSVLWPAGVEGQAITAGPSGLLTSQVSASITITRTDGKVFDLTTFTAKILGNTAGAGASFEIMPQLNGQDGLANPLTFDATGYAGNSFTYSTPMLTGYDTYNISLWMDFALTGLNLLDAGLPPVPPRLQILLASSNSVVLSWPTNAVGFTLEQTPGLTTAGWTGVTALANTVGTNYQWSLPRTNGACFFRLRHP